MDRLRYTGSLLFTSHVKIIRACGVGACPLRANLPHLPPLHPAREPIHHSALTFRSRGVGNYGEVLQLDSLSWPLIESSKTMWSRKHETAPCTTAAKLPPHFRVLGPLHGMSEVTGTEVKGIRRLPKPNKQHSFFCPQMIEGQHLLFAQKRA